MTVEALDLEAVAREHGVRLSDVAPPSHGERMIRLEAILADQSVPFPVPPEVAQPYLAAARAGEPFGVGQLTEERPVLGEYADFQRYESIPLEDHLSWACLIADQQATKEAYACREYLEGERTFSIDGDVIPDYYELNARIYQQTGWQLASVNMIIPASLFFGCHRLRYFPVTTFMRSLGTDYLQEPDIGHDVAGHVATFTIPEVALVMNEHGLAQAVLGEEAEARIAAAATPAEEERIRAETEELLSLAGRIYWFTVEFGLVMEDRGLRAFGAGILSSPGETRYSIDSPIPTRVLIDPSKDEDLLRLATTDYLSSEFQKTYFVMKSFDTLGTVTTDRILETVRRAQRLPHHTWRELVPGDQVINVGADLSSPNEKYARMAAGQPLDEALERTARRNLRMYAEGIRVQDSRDRSFLAGLPPVPPELLPGG